MKSIIEKNTGKLICATAIEVDVLENEILVDELLTEFMNDPYFDFETRTFYENAK
jgi:hypothetical protein